MSLQVFLMICKQQCSAQPTFGGRSMIVWATVYKGRCAHILTAIFFYVEECIIVGLEHT